LYGRRIQWQSAQPDQDMQKARSLLAGCGITAEIVQLGLTMEETFISFMEGEG